jgi:hypothetical protein
MTAQVPLRSDFVINFTNFRSGNTDIDLSAIDNYICVIAAGSPSNSYIVKKDYSLSPSSFVIDIPNRKVSIRILADELTEEVTHYVNLYLYTGADIVTNIAKCFETKTSINPA